MNRFKALLLIALTLGMAGLGYAQTSLTQTTLAAAVSIGAQNLASGTATGFNQTYVQLASATNVQQAVNGQPVTFFYVDQELFGVLTVLPGQTTFFNVLRGQMGTKEAAHVSGTNVLVGSTSPQYAGFSGSGGFQVTDPPFNGACTATGTGLTPWINVLTGYQWLCSTVTGTWVPGFSNPFATDVAKVTAAVASAAGLVVPSGPLFHITGALAITGFTVPVGFNATAAGGGAFCVIPDGTFTTTTANNIALASTAVVNKLLCWQWDATNSKFVPSY